MVMVKVSEMKMYMCREFKDVRKLKNESQIQDSD